MPHPLPQLFAQLSHVASHLITLGPPTYHSIRIIPALKAWTPNTFHSKHYSFSILLPPSLPKPICKKAWVPKTNCSYWSIGTMVRKWKTHSGKHHPTPENKNPTLKNITSSPKNQNPLHPKPAKTIVRINSVYCGKKKVLFQISELITICHPNRWFFIPLFLVFSLDFFVNLWFFVFPCIIALIQ